MTDVLSIKQRRVVCHTLTRSLRFRACPCDSVHPLLTTQLSVPRGTTLAIIDRTERAGRSLASAARIDRCVGSSMGTRAGIGYVPQKLDSTATADDRLRPPTGRLGWHGVSDHISRKLRGQRRIPLPLIRSRTWRCRDWRSAGITQEPILSGRALVGAFLVWCWSQGKPKPAIIGVVFRRLPPLAV